MVLTTAVSGNLLGACGLLYSSDGGNVFEKIHPASYLLYLSLAILCVSRRGLGARIMELASRETELAIAISAFSATTILTLCVQGSGAAVILLDTFLPAVCAALSFLAGGYEYRRKLRVLLLACLLGNAAIAVIETCLQVNFIPAADAEFIDRPEFRAMALFDHPLTGASAELMSLIMILRSNWSFFPKFFALITTMAALCAFGGRVALGLALVTLIHSVTSITPSRKAVYSTALSLVVAMLICSMSFLSIEKFTSRALNHFYWDSSAQVRIVQFLIVAKLNTTEIFFGCRRSDLFRIIEQSYLQDSVGVVENYWLLMFLLLGAVGFPLFVGGMMSILAWCLRRGGPTGLWMTICFIASTSSSNSLGRKSMLLTLFVACSIAAAPRACLPGDGSNKRDEGKLEINSSGDQLCRE
jgi:hypothetical protein